MAGGYISVRRNYVRVGGRSVEKQTKTHRMRRVSLDPSTVEVLQEHREQYEDAMRQLDVEPTDEAFLFSYEPTFNRPYDPSGVTHRYARMCAGRLGHAGGGATTLRVYAAWVGEADRRAAHILGGRLRQPKPSTEPCNETL
ncbi:hypothetical protein [Saccharomonospora cyanea]|uniref:hypothetical protein n=1 Tax=Saccharomonospora cyanea TaxID=40989 RepID=UPI0012FC1910|nr:hypothetical protein [Saccharomonospora cyanea]